MKIEASWNDLPLLVKQMERVNGTHRITQCKNVIAHYSKIKGYHCRRGAELTFCIVTWWWFNQVLSFTSHPGACRFRRCCWMKKLRGSVAEGKKKKRGNKPSLSLFLFGDMNRAMQIFQSNKESRKSLINWKSAKAKVWTITQAKKRGIKNTNRLKKKPPPNMSLSVNINHLSNMLLANF